MQPSMSADNTEDDKLAEPSDLGELSSLSPTDSKLTVASPEIEILYDIVREAQKLPESSSLALIDAYNTVLRKNALSHDEESIIYKLLLLIQGETKEPSFVKRFQNVLETVGFTVDCNSDGEGIEHTTELNLPADEDTTRNGLENQFAVRIPSRRGSFDSFFDGTADKIAGTESEVPIRVRRGSRDVASDVGGYANKRRSRSDSDARAQFVGQMPFRNGNGVNGNRTGNRRTTYEQVKTLPQQRRGSASTRGSIRIHRNGVTVSRQLGEYDAEDESEQTEQTDSFDVSHVIIPGVNAPIPGTEYNQYALHYHEQQDHHDYDYAQQHMTPEAYHPSDTQMVSDAEALEHQRIHTVARRCFQIWRTKTKEQVERVLEMEVQAYNTDRKALLRQSLSSWQESLQTIRQERETERFFSRLETRAEKARNLFLLTKAFTHWATSAEDEVQRTSVARRHILRTRYFKCWRDVTVVNEMKTQHLVLGKFLQKWRLRLAALQFDNDMAEATYDDNLTKRMYQHWSRRFFDNQALGIYYRNLLSRLVKQWHDSTSAVIEKQVEATDRRNVQIVRRALDFLKQRASTICQQEDQARNFRQKNLLSFVFNTIRKKALLAPALAQFTAVSNTRRLSTVFRIWRRNTQLNRQAQAVDRTRLLRNAFTAWNDALRTNAIVDRINDRVIVEAMYKWALASRVALFRRVQDRKLKESAWATWVARTQDRGNSLDRAERRFAQWKREKLLRGALGKIEAKTVERKTLEYQANSTYEPKLKQQVFHKLREKLGHIQELQEWSRNARFYVLTTHTLKTWNDATQQSRRNRRRDTYIQVRRNVKMNLVRRVFGHWREKAAHLAIMDRQAEELVEDRVLRSSTNLFNRWRNRTTIIRDLEAQATHTLTTKLASTTLSLLLQRHQYLQNLHTQAIALRQETAEIAASSCLKKLGWRLFNLQRQEETALALRERNFEKHVRAMIKFWFEQTVERAAQRLDSPTPSSRRSRRSHQDDEDNLEDNIHSHGAQGRRGRRGQQDFSPSRSSLEEGGAEAEGDDTRRLEAWTAFDENALGLSTNLDLSLSLSPKHKSPRRPIPNIRLTPRAAQTYPLSAMKAGARPTPIVEVEDEGAFGEGFGEELDEELGNAPFWTSTPLPPGGKPGYLKTPSKRSVVRIKRAELPPSPEKRDRIGLLVRGAMSAPPKSMLASVIEGRGVSSFERRLREGGVQTGDVGNIGLEDSARKGTGRWKGKGRTKGNRVGFGDVSLFG
jgi:protein SFI1